MEQRSGQPLSPCVGVNDEMLADVSGDEVEAYMLEKGEITENRSGRQEYLENLINEYL